MKESSDREELMIRYLLGQLPEEEQVRLEEQFLTDPESYEELLAIEDELRYDYVKGELVGREREQFKSRFLATPEDRKKVAFAAALITKVSPSESVLARTVSSSPSHSVSWWPQLLSLINLQNPVVRYSFAAAILVVAVGGMWLIYQQFRAGGPEEIAQQEQQSQPQQDAGPTPRPNDVTPDSRPTPSDEPVVDRPPQPTSTRDRSKPQTPSAPVIAAFVLTPGLTRDTSQLKQLTIERTAERVRLELQLRGQSEHKSYRVVLRTFNGVNVWSRTGLVKRPAGTAKTLVALVPNRLLNDGDYELILQRATPDGNYEDIDEYYFRVVKK